VGETAGEICYPEDIERVARRGCGSIILFRGGAAMPTPKARFRLGQVVATPGAAEAIEAATETAYELIARHVTGDWGDLDEEDKRENEYSVENNLRILSAYVLSTGVKIWLITEADRSATTLLLPSEY
jgi:hypothetical protein